MPKGVSAPQAVVIDGAGRVWLTEKLGRNLLRFNPDDGQFTVYPLPEEWGAVGPSRLAVTRQGEIWFTVRRWVDADSRVSLLGQFIPGPNQFRLHSLPDGMVPEDLVVDNQGVIWFTHPDANSLQRFNPGDGLLKGYALPTPDAYPRGLTVDKDGGIWFAEANVNRVGHFQPKGETFKEYELPTPFANPGMVSVDREGRVWVVEMTANKLGVYYPDWQRFDEVQIPTPRGTPNAVDTDGEGHVWVLEYHGNRVGHFNPHEAVFREYDIPTYGSLPGNLVVDAERKRLWFTETSTEARKLGMLDLQRLPAAVGTPGAAGVVPAAGHGGMGHHMGAAVATPPAAGGGQPDMFRWWLGGLLGVVVLGVLVRQLRKRRVRT
ncbi:MAG: hypothetical protein H7838_05205 [Magnetococcus sp. DMHC-8]